MMFRSSIAAFMAFTAVAAFADTVTVDLYAVGDTKGASSLSPSSVTLTVGQAPSNTLEQLSAVSRTGYTLDASQWRASFYYNNTGNEANRVFDSDWCSTQAKIDVSGIPVAAGWTMLVVPVTPNPYTVTFSANGGAGSMADQSFVYDAPQNLTSNAFTRTGHTFARWTGPGNRTFADGEVVSNLTAEAEGVVTLTAQWAVNTYRITLDAGDADTPGTEWVDAQYGRTFQSITLPTRRGYAFGGYYTQPDGQGDLCYLANGAPSTSYLAADTTIYAYWIQNPTVTLDPNGGGLLKGWTTTTNYAVGVGLRLPSAAEGEIAYTNRIFDGWYYRNGTGPVTAISSSDSGDKEFIAHWRGAVYTVNFNANGGTGQGSQPNMDMTGSPNLTAVADLNIARRGYTFVSWNTAADGSGAAYGDGAVITEPLSTVPGGIVTLYAQWQPNTYEVVFEPNGADGGETMADQSFTYDVTQNLDHVVFTYTGHAFERWSSDTNYNYQTTYYADGAEVANLATGGVVTLYANWTGIVYTVTFDANGGTGAMDPLSCTYDVPTNLPACAFARDGWGFKGWAADGAEGVLFADGARVTNLTATVGAEVALLACWTGVTYAVTLDARDSRGDGMMTNDVGEAVSVLTNLYTVGDAWDLPMPTNGNEHLSFNGWKYVDAQGRAKDVPAEVPPPSQGITNLVASWLWVADALAVAVDAPELPFRTFGTEGPLGAPSDDPLYGANWFVQSDFTCEGGTAVQSGALQVPEPPTSDFYATWLTTTVTGAGVLSFQWKCAARERYKTQDELDPSNDIDSGDALRFGLCNADGSFTEIARMEATRDWEGFVYTNDTAEAVTFAWTFQFNRGGIGANGEGLGGGTGWVDHVTWTPEGGTQPDDPEPPAIEESVVSFDKNGGEGEMAAQTFTNGVEQALSSNAFTRTGHAFSGWATNSTGGVVYADGQSVTVDANAVLYAVWTPNVYTISFLDRGDEVASITQDYGTEVASPEAPSRTGYAFAGWMPTVPATVPASNVTCTAQWTPNTYTVTFNANGGAGEMADQTFTYDQSSCLSSNAFTKSDNAFDGWATASDGDAVYADGAAVSNLTSEANGLVTLYAHWTATGGGDPDPGPGPVEPGQEWTVTFDANGGTGEMAAQTFTNGVEQALSSNAFTRTGYAFSGWATNETEGVVYTDGQSVILETNTVLYALWTPNTYTVTFDANGGAGEMADQAFTYDLASCLSSNVFTKSGYSFAGWATNETGAAAYADGAEVLNLTDVADGTVTLYAQWTENVTPDPEPEPVCEIAFAEGVVEVDEGSNAIVRVSGGHMEKACSVKVYLTYNTAAAADLDLAHGSVGSVATALKFPLTLKWEAGEVGEKLVTIPVNADALVEGEEFFTLQLAGASGAQTGAQTVCTVRIADAQWNADDIEAATSAALPAGATTVTNASGVVMGYFTKKNSKGNVTAKAMPGYVFVAWVYTANGKTYSTKATITDKLRKAKKVQPKFAVAHVLRGLADPANGGKVTGSGKYAHGKTVTLKATPTKNWSFEGWFAADDSTVLDSERRLSKSTSYKVSVTNDVTYFAAFKPYPKVKLAVDNKSGGTVKGAGSYKTGTKVTLKATPKKGYAFTGWWQVAVDAEGVCTTNLVSLAASYAYKVTADGLALTASFKKEGALTKPTLTWGGETNLTVGVSYSAKLTVAGESAVVITKVTGLPAGLTYKSGKVSGVPTTKKVYTAKVTVALKSNAKKTWTHNVKLNVSALPTWAAGKTFKGTLSSGEGESAVSKGTVTLTVGKTGKVSGKFVNLKKTAYAFTASSFKTYGEDGVLRTKATLKYGKKSVTLDVAVGAEEVAGEDSSTSLRGFAEIYSAAAPFSGETVTLR